MLASGLSRSIKDGDWELLEWAPELGRTTWVMYDGDKTHIRHDYQVGHLVENNLLARNSASSGWNGDWHKVASVPLNLHYDENAGLHKAMTEGDDAFVRRFLNDGDNAAWRTKEGRV